MSLIGPTKLNNFKKIHFKKLMITRLHTIAKVEKIREAFEEIKVKSNLTSIKPTRGNAQFRITKENLKRSAFVVAYVKDMICMTILREILDMKILFDIHSTQVEFMEKSDIKFLARKWFSGGRSGFSSIPRSKKRQTLAKIKMKRPLN